ncbi:MAG: 50S ribosomal protein L23 [Candidatus Woesebacteria bacterium GW2011_GWC2_47_16]|uniref:Large ribosomal subunit protein uL23 n=8 Tax=Candidatus Woeseibacteriota TaxID=1752722 RepID=A0A0G1UXS6_9BACT|nr:MAG: 50S ribosomal protein L23 [Candidatus Woesebacteria bacterium GW2011_GWE1_45_18]KKU23835.1 MAG: 50S ribosomal protein L23 [Candidatus Woesebacteria bacterium GW2011_GWF1_46_13]KKU64474.1 MAG: 50S ribosomal protein L23 [Candidatus Woesebacteria bacterium GW2011_GWC2_47_16]KKU70828.1 MAG: 50S ribosomal protein L23 [Candidatus Woesebacteria bacterium GW2011_GWD1_47_21]OGM78776.1 MAG: 50S ribosomal protein L23 [Candidatus Woesebacteria bacterium RIFOXYA1_FULL_48_16]OGM82199.1 MAG: 50S ribo
MKLTPVLTEKSLKEAKKGHYTFGVSPSLTKEGVRALIERVFEVKVGRVWTMNLKGGVKKNLRGRTQVVKGVKKAIVTLKEGKIDIFEEKGKKK